MNHGDADDGWILWVLAAVFFLGLVIYGFRERAQGEERRQRRRKRARNLQHAEHALEKETEKLLPRAVATIHHEPDAAKRDTNAS